MDNILTSTLFPNNSCTYFKDIAWLHNRIESFIRCEGYSLDLDYYYKVHSKKRLRTHKNFAIQGTLLGGCLLN
jgi:hypothetical protein